MVALVLDGKSFAEDEMVVALGVTLEGDKVFLGFVQTDTENAVVIRSFLRGLKDRGLDLSAGALVVIDGAKGLRSGVLAAFKDQVLIQRCQWHKRENVISHLPRAEQKNWRRRLQRAYQRPTYKEAAQALKTPQARARRGEPVCRGQSKRGVRGDLAPSTGSGSSLWSAGR